MVDDQEKLRHHKTAEMSRRQAISWLLGVGLLGMGPPLQKIIQLFAEDQQTIHAFLPERLTQTTPLTKTETQIASTTGTTNDAFEIISQALAERQTRIHLPTGNYSVSNSIKISQPNVEIYGDGQNSTVLRLNNGVLADMFSFVSANNFHVHDLQIDGNRQNQPYTPPTPRYGGAVNISGIDAWNCSYGLVENCFIHDCRTFGILYSQCTGCTIQDNCMQNCDANGVTIDNSTGGSGCRVKRNMVDGASDVGITGSDAVNLLVEKNTIKNITMNTSPFEQNTNIGVACEGNNAGCLNCSYVENTIENTLVGAYIGFVNGLSFRKNTINGIIATGNGFPGIPFGINVDTKTLGVDIENCLIEGIPNHTTTPIVQLLSPSGGTFKNNSIYTNGGTLPIWAPNSGWTIIGNKLT